MEQWWHTLALSDVYWCLAMRWQLPPPYSRPQTNSAMLTGSGKGLYPHAEPSKSPQAGLLETEATPVQANHHLTSCQGTPQSTTGLLWPIFWSRDQDQDQLILILIWSHIWSDPIFWSFLCLDQVIPKLIHWQTAKTEVHATELVYNNHYNDKMERYLWYLRKWKHFLNNQFKNIIVSLHFHAFLVS